MSSKPVAFVHQAGGAQTTLGYNRDSDTTPTIGANQTLAVAFGGNDASAQETDSASILRTLRSEVGEEAFTEWMSRILDSLQSPEVLQSAMHGCGIRCAAREAGLWLDDGALARPESVPSESLRRLWEDGPDGRSPQGRELAQQLAREFGAPLPFLPHQNAQGFQVRRLSVRECERLMGLPDDWTHVPYRGKPAADGPRYKALGNSFAVNAVQWLGHRIQLIDDLLAGRDQR